MSLVINSNEAGNGGFVLSNSEIRTYPNFKQLLLFPAFPNKQIISNEGGAAAIDVQYTDITAFSVNGTIVNFANQILDEEKIYTGNFSGGNLGDSMYFGQHTRFTYNLYENPNGTKKSYIYRMGFPEPVESGLIIGKEVITHFGIGSILNYSANTAISGNTQKFYQELFLRIGLLHADGTITYGNWNSILKTDVYTTTSVSTGETKRYYINFNNTTCFEDSGLTTIEGDRIIAELRVEHVAEGYNPSNQSIFVYNDTWIGAGFMGTPGNYVEYQGRSSTMTGNWPGNFSSYKVRARPIQISIE